MTRSPSDVMTLNTFLIPQLPTLDLPPLPFITDRSLRETVFTHISASPASLSPKRRHNRSLLIHEVDTASNYEKLEHVGDAIQEAIVVSMLHEMYPNFSEGTASIVRDKLVCNSSLAQISFQYGLPDRVVCLAQDRHTLKKNDKVQASIFEAYIAGVFYSILGKKDDVTPTFSSYSRSSDGQDSDTSMGSVVINEAVTEDEGKPSLTPFTVENNECNSASSSDTSSESETYTDPDEETSYDGLGNLFQEDESDPKTDSSSDGSTNTDHSSGGESASNPEDFKLSRDISPGNSSETVKPPKTRGEAFDVVFDWLQQVFEPIARFAVAELRVEEKRLAEERRKSPTRGELPFEWAAEDIKAVGGKATLHSSAALVALPTYEHTGVKTRSKEVWWKVVCKAKDNNDTVWTAEATRMTKQAASNVAAWKMCVEMGLIKEDD